jgi:hypothetical protein
MSESEHKTGYVAEFDPPLEKKHECPVCMYALREPIQTACGHRFCTACIKQILQKPRSRCPLDNEQLSKDEIFPDNFCRREVLSLTVRCGYNKKGCPWLGALKDLENHEKTCEFMMVTCTNEGCQVTVPAKDLAHHKEYDCKFRIIPCAMCGNPIIFSQQRDHFSRDCPDIKVECENGCGTKVKRKEMSEHLSTCENVKVPCPFNSLGCEFEETKQKVEAHQNENLRYHMSLMLSKLKDVSRTSEQQEGKEEESLGSLPSIASLVGIRSVAVSSSSEINTGQKQDRVAALAAQVDSLVSNMEDASQQIQAKDSIIQEQKLQIEEMHVIVKNLQATVQPLLSDLKDCQQEVIATGSRTTSFEQKQIAAHSKVAAMEHRLVAIEKNLTMKDNALAEHDVRLLSLEMTSYDGVLRWKITEFVRRRSEAIAGRRLSIYSPPFFTSRNGYKMCARIYLNGDGMGKGSHLSLFFVIMKGEFDALLPWPFQQRVTFTLIDQEHRRHVSDTFQPDPSSSSFQRPTTDMNVASGCPLFVPLEALETRGYVKDDTMFIRVAVEIKGLIHP